MKSTRYSSHVLNKLDFLRQIFEKNANIKFCENSFSRSRVVPSRRTDPQTGMSKLIVVFRHFWNGPKMGQFY